MNKKRQAVRGIHKEKNENTGKVVAVLSTLAGIIWRPKLLLLSIFVVSGSILVTQINMQKVLPISSVKIEGEFKYLDKEQLRKQAMPVVDGGFFSVDLSAVRNVFISLPWVEDVSVRRQWPDQLLVRVIEKKPVVYWGDNAVLSAKGVLFIPGKKLSENLPYLKGPEGLHKTMFQELARMQAWLLETGLHIQRMSLDERRSWTLKMTDGIELRLGREKMHQRLQRFASVYKNNFQSEIRKIKHIDMRYTNGFAVAWTEA
jgi:cell division protein FtsQ